jgi:hypothetical protein
MGSEVVHLVLAGGMYHIGCLWWFENLELFSCMKRSESSGECLLLL